MSLTTYDNACHICDKRFTTPWRVDQCSRCRGLITFPQPPADFSGADYDHSQRTRWGRLRHIEGYYCYIYAYRTASGVLPLYVGKGINGRWSLPHKNGAGKHALCWQVWNLAKDHKQNVLCIARHQMLESHAYQYEALVTSVLVSRGYELTNLCPPGNGLVKPVDVEVALAAYGHLLPKWLEKFGGEP